MRARSFFLFFKNIFIFAHATASLSRFFPRIVVNAAYVWTASFDGDDLDVLFSKPDHERSHRGGERNAGGEATRSERRAPRRGQEVLKDQGGNDEIWNKKAAVVG